MLKYILYDPRRTMKGLRVLSDHKDLLLLGNKNAYAILNLLREQEYSGTGVAKVLGIKAQLATYYLNKLEKRGLAEIVRTEQVHGIMKKFFRATAEHFLILSNVGEENDELDLSFSCAYLEELQFTKMEDKIDDCIDLIVDDCLKVTQNDKVLLQYRDNTSKYLEKFVTKLRNIGADYRSELVSSDLVQYFWSSLPIDRIQLIQQYKSEKLKWLTVFIVIGKHGRPNLADIPEDRVKAVNDTIFKTKRAFMMNNKMRYAHFQIFQFEEDFFTDSKILERLQMYWNAASLKNEDYSVMKHTADYLLKNNSLRIFSSHHNELSIKLNRDKFIINAGPFSSASGGNEQVDFSIPSGCLAVIPEDNSINGDIFCDVSVVDGIKGVRLRIENNIVTEAKADDGLEELQSKLNKFGVDGRTVGVVFFGLNSGIRNGEILPELVTDMNGSFSLCFGHNEYIGGKIKNVPTWDLTCMSPEIKEGGRLILKDNDYRV
jgi:leucyl aminopeptidase (aminopeptidase T)/DNA-binding MarR family transcriptional regulator